MLSVAWRRNARAALGTIVTVIGRLCVCIWVAVVTDNESEVAVHLFLAWSALDRGRQGILIC